MRCPRKIYLVISRTAKDALQLDFDAFDTHKEAQQEANSRNFDEWCGATDWRVETFVKGD